MFNHQQRNIKPTSRKRFLVKALFGSIALLSCSWSWAGHVNGKAVWIGCNSASHECYLQMDSQPTNSGCAHNGLFVWRMDTGTGEKIYQMAERALLDDGLYLEAWYAGCSTTAYDGYSYPILSNLWLARSPHRGHQPMEAVAETTQVQPSLSH